MNRTSSTGISVPSAVQDKELFSFCDTLFGILHLINFRVLTSPNLLPHLFGTCSLQKTRLQTLAWPTKGRKTALMWHNESKYYVLLMTSRSSSNRQYLRWILTFYTFVVHINGVFRPFVGQTRVCNRVFWREQVPKRWGSRFGHVRTLKLVKWRIPNRGDTLMKKAP